VEGELRIRKESRLRRTQWSILSSGALKKREGQGERGGKETGTSRGEKTKLRV